MRGELQALDNPSGPAFRASPARAVVPSPARGGRYRIEVRPADGPLPCGHQSPRALLWLIFLEGEQEAAREVAEVICSGCDPGRFARAQVWAEALAG